MVEVLNTVECSRKTAPDVERVEADAVNTAGQRSLYASRVAVHPKEVHGFFRRLKWIVMAVTLGIYYLAPWIRWDRGPHAPDQAILVDLANRRFYFFFLEIWPQEFYYVAGLLIMAGIGLFLVTSAVGRAWCGYTCPQTVWTDLFVAVERRVEGDRNARIKLDAEPMSAEKFIKRSIKYTMWFIIALATGGAWVFYFADAPTLFKQLILWDAPAVAYLTILTLTATTFIFAGFMREQVCTYMCPWPRIQAAMLDEDSLTVTYNAWRGEERGSQRERRLEATKQFGDCIDCNLCVAVCPMGIDIRNGNQLECITCALCIDACNGVMEKVGKPKDLISYTTLRAYNAHAAGHAEQAPLLWREIIRPRTMIYMGVWALIGIAMLVSVANRATLDINVLHDRNPLFVTLSDGSVRNGYTVKILNMAQKPRTFDLKIDDLPGATMQMVGDDDPPSTSVTIPVEADKLRMVKIYVTAPASSGKERADFRFDVKEKGGEEAKHYEAFFQWPKND
ncbi:MAG: cytochrome c oxidase accessory protein CcoG [Hyphomicrobiales bacterium]